MNVVFELYMRASADIEGITGDVWQRQEAGVIQALEDVYEHEGIDGLIEVLNGVVEYSKAYDGKYMGQDVLFKEVALLPPLPLPETMYG